MMKPFVFASVALLAFTQTVGIAAADPKGTVAPDAAASPAAKAEKDRASGPRYCVVHTATGSRIPIKVCKTRGEWLAEGVDPLDP